MPAGRCGCLGALGWVEHGRLEWRNCRPTAAVAHVAKRVPREVGFRYCICMRAWGHFLLLSWWFAFRRCCIALDLGGWCRPLFTFVSLASQYQVVLRTV
jgi:hypothetical protein